jgi:tetratricopeptide (TPR) repeat protein
VATSVSNNYQKATSALKLGDLFFDIPKYKLSQAYYDTAVQALPEDYPNSKEIIARSSYLTELIENLIVVETEDSLQRVALMPEEERLALIDKIIEKLKEEEEEQKRLDEIMALNAENMASNPTSSPTSGAIGSGGWYFYNPTAITNGLSEFKKKWGNRKLEDNWRLSNKESLFEQEEEDLQALNDSTMLGSDSTGVVIAKSSDPHTVGYYLQNLPFTEEQVLTSNGKIETALYNLGYIYKDKLNNLPVSVETFESLTNRFPETEHRLESLYQLYRLNTILENYEQADYYKNLIVGEYPDSDYAKLITDPEYFKLMQAEQNRALTMYNETWVHYQSGNYYTVYSNSTRALSEFKEPVELLAKFEYLRALSLGKIEVIDSLQVALENMVKKYPTSEVTPLAQNILDYLTGPIDTTSTTEPEVKFDVSMYEFDPKSKQLFALVVNGQKVNINALKVRISDFNIKFYSLDNLSITSILLDKITHFIMVGNFETKKEAMRYYNALMSNEYVFANLDQEQYNGFVLAQENYPVFYKDKDVEKYLAFFKQNYLDQ